MYLVESVADVEKLEAKNPEFLAFVTQTTLSVDDTSEVIAALRPALSEYSRPEERGYLLHYAKPPGLGQETHWRV